MTVHYQHIVATERVGGFFRLLLRWRGSIYKHVFGEIGIFMVLYYIINLCYRFAMDEHQKRKFEKFCEYCGGFTDYIPVTFVVGFYVVRVIVRRWTQWENMPWPEKLAFDVSTYVQGTDVMTRMIRRTIMRYTNLASILCFRDICVPAKKRFPQMDNLLVAGLITPKELEVFTKTSSNFDINWWIPFHWAYTLIWRAMREGKVTEGGMMRLHDGVNDLRTRCWVLFMHDWIPIPMVYTQVCTLSVYIYMVACLFGRQYITSIGDKKGEVLDLYVPIFTIFQLIFYLGWMKVAEVLINPLGMDADDFDVNYIIDRNLRTSYTVVDYAFQRLPPLEKDVHWDMEEPQLPHTESSKEAGAQPFTGSAANFPESPTDNKDELGSTRDLNENDGTQLLGRKTSRGSMESSAVSQRDRFTSVTSKIRRLLSRQNTASTNDESKRDALKDLLDVEDADRVGNWQWSPSLERSLGGKWQRLANNEEANYRSTTTLPRIEEADQSNENTLTKVTGAPLAPKLRSFTTAPPAQLRNPELLTESEQQDILMDLLRSSPEASTSSVYRPQREDGSRFTTAAVQQDAAGVPFGSALLPPAGHEGVEPPPTQGQSGEGVKNFEGGGRFDMTHHGM